VPSLLVIPNVGIPPLRVIGDVHSRWIIKRYVSYEFDDPLDRNQIKPSIFLVVGANEYVREFPVLVKRY